MEIIRTEILGETGGIRTPHLLTANHQKAGSIASIFDRADDNMKVTPGGWYWFYHNGTPELVKMQENDETKLDDGNSHPLRVIRYIEYEPTEHLPQ